MASALSVGFPDRFMLDALEARLLLSGEGVILPQPMDSGSDQAGTLAAESAFETETPFATTDTVSAALDFDILSGVEAEPFAAKAEVEAETEDDELLPASDLVPESVAVEPLVESNSIVSPAVEIAIDGGVVTEAADVSTLVVTTAFVVGGGEVTAASGALGGPDDVLSQAEMSVTTLTSAQGPPGSGAAALAALQGLSARVTPLRPLLVIPGIAGSFPSVGDYSAWLVQRGFDPEKMLIDPLTGGYTDLVQTLINSGYTKNVDLFEATYDWRVTPGPDDGVIDGFIDNGPGEAIDAAQITDAEYAHGVDYLGYWLTKAAVAWAMAPGHGNTLPSEVDVIAHSTGGLVVRVYIQSGAYGDVAPISGGKFGNGIAVPAGLKDATGTAVTTGIQLPTVHDLVTMGVPMRGAPTPFQLSQDDWGADWTYVGLAKVMNMAYQLNNFGITITGPNGSDIAGHSLTDPMDPVEFIRAYCPTLYSLTATYPFLYQDGEFVALAQVEERGGSVPFNESSFANRVAIDLNDGLDLYYSTSQLAADWSYTETATDPHPGTIRRPTHYINSLGGELTVVYSESYATATRLTQRVGPGAWTEIGDYDVTPFGDYIASYPDEGKLWYLSDYAAASASLPYLMGDGSVPVESSKGLYAKVRANARPFIDPNPKLNLEDLAYPGDEDLTHVGMLSSVKGLTVVLQALGRFDARFIVTGNQSPGEADSEYFESVEQPAGPSLQAPPAATVVSFNSAQLGAIADGLLAVKAVVLTGFLSTVPALNQQVALLGRTLGEGPLALAGILDATFSVAAAAIRILPSGATADDVIRTLSNAGLVATGGLVDASSTRLTLLLTLSRSMPSVSDLILGGKATEQGITFSTVPQLVLDNYFFLTARLELDATAVGGDLFGLTSFAAMQGVAYHGRGIAVAPVMGSAGPAQVADGAVNVNASAAQKLSEPSGDRRLTSTEMTATPIETISTTEGQGYVEAVLPTDTADGKVIYATSTVPVGAEPDVVVGSSNFEAIKDRLKQLLVQLAALGDALENPAVQVALQIRLPFLDDPNNDTLDELLTDDRYGFGLNDFFDFVDLLQQYCDEAAEPNLGEFIGRLASELRLRLGDLAEGALPQGPLGISGGFSVDSDAFELLIDIDLSRAIELVLTEEGFGPEAEAFGFDLSIPAVATLGFEAQIALGMDLSGLLDSPSSGLSKQDVTLAIHQLRTTFDLVVEDIDATLQLGFLTAGIVDGTAELHAAVNFAVGGGAPLSLATLQSTNLTTLVSTAPGPVGTLDVRLPLTASIGEGAATPLDCEPVITITDGQIFDGTPPTVTASNFECLVDFSNLSPMQVLAMLKGLGDWLEQFRVSPVFGLTVPFASGMTLGDLFDFSQVFIDRVYAFLVSPQILPFNVHLPEVGNLGRLSMDAEFDIALGDLPSVHVVVPAIDTRLNLSLEDLVVDFNAALQLAGLGVSLEAFMGSGRRLGIRLKPGIEIPDFKLTVPDLDGSIATPNLNAMVAELGFGELQMSLELPRFTGLEDFGELLSEALGVDGINLEWVEATGEIRMEVAFTELFERTVSFAFDPNLGLGPLADASAGGTFLITGEVNAGFVLGFDLNHLATPRIQTNPMVPPPSTGVLTRNAEFTLVLDDARHVIRVARDIRNASLADLVADINAQFSAEGLADQVIAGVSGNAITLEVLDEDADGDGVFDAGEDRNGDGNFDSQLGQISLLQIIGEDDNTAFTELGLVNGQFDRADVKGLFVDDVVLDGSARISATDLDAAFRFGIFAIIAENGAVEGSAAVNVGLQSPTGGTRFLLSELKAAAPDFGSLLKVAPVITGSIDLTAPTLTVEPELIDIPADQPLRIYIPDIHFTDYNSAPYNSTTNPTGLFLTVPTMGGLGNFSCFTFLNIVQALDTLADELETMQGFGFLGQKLPLINRSISDLLDSAGNFAELVQGLATGDADTIETLEHDLEEFFQVSDPRLISLSVEDYSPAPFDSASDTVPVSTRFNPSGIENALRFRARAADSALRDVVVQFIDDGRYSGTVADADAEYDATNHVLRIYYHAGYTTAATLVAAVRDDASLPFTAELDTAVESGTGKGTVSLTALKFSLHYNLAYGDFLPLDLDLNDLIEMLPEGDPARALLGGLSSFVQLEGSADINVAASADVLIEFGIDVSNACGWVPFLYDTTGFTLNASVRGTDIDFTAAVGPLGVMVRDGTVTVDRDGDPDTTGTGEDAVFGVIVRDPDGDGRHYLRDGLSFVSDLDIVLEAGASANLPMYFPTETIPVGSNRDDNRDGHPDNELVIDIPDLPDLFNKSGSPVQITTPDLASLLTNFNVCDLVANASLLLDGLDALLGMIQDGLDSEVLNRNLPLVGTRLSKAGNLIGEFREGLLADIRAKLATAGDPIELVKQAFWKVLGGPGLNLLVNARGDPLASVEDIDIGCESVDGEVVLLFNIRLGRTIDVVDTESDPIDFDIGIPGLGLSVEGNVKVEIGFNLNLFFGISSEDGFFFDTNGLNDDSPADDSELTVFFRVTIPGLSATGNLLFLQVQVGDASGGGRSPSLFDGNFAVDLFDADGRLSFGEMMGGGFDLGRVFDVTLDAVAAVRLDLEISFGDDARFPRILAQFDLDWSWDPDGDTGGENSEGELEFGFHNLQLDLGSFISQFLGPILDEIAGVIEPVKPLVDLLTTPLPIFSDLDGSPITLLKLGENAGLIAPTTREFIEAVDVILELVADTSFSGTGSILVDLGSFDLLLDRLGNVGAAGTLPESDIDITGGVDDEDALGFLDQLESIGFTFPFLRISELFKLFTGQPVSFVEFEMPLLEFEASIDFQIPIFPPLYIIFGGSIGATIDLTFGYDSLGLQKYFASSDKNLADLLDGFYVKDVDDYGNEITEVLLTGGLFAGAELDILVASAGVTGGIYADVLFDLRDNDGDGRVRVSEIVENAKESPLCVFEVSGRIYASLDAFLKANLLIAKIEKEWNFGEITLLEFGIDCPMPTLASVDSDGELLLHMGEFAALREYGDTADGSERFTVRSVTSLSGGSQTVTVSFGGYTQTYPGVKSILAKGGAGNDTIDLTGVEVPATVYGGDGDDTIKASRGGGTYWGDNGNDSIRSEETSSAFAGVNDTFHGGAGNDELEGFDGADKLYGDEGDDALDGGNGNDTLEGGAGNDVLVGGDGRDTLKGEEGTDELGGGAGNDTLFGGDGDDRLEGDEDDDKLTGNAGNDELYGGTGNDVLVGDEGSIVSLLQITGVSGSGNDLLSGGPGSDTLMGAGGNDDLYGGNHIRRGVTSVVPVAYSLSGGTLNVEPDGADFLDGGEGDDVLFADDAHSGLATSFPGAELGDRVWLDLDEDGIQDEGEAGLSGVSVELYASGGTTALAHTVTDAEGLFRFSGLVSGDYFVRVKAPKGTTFTTALAGDDETKDSDIADPDGNGVGDSSAVTLDTGESDLSIDAGIRGGTPTVAISDASLIEGDTGEQALIFAVSLSSPAADVVTVIYRTGADSDAATENAVAGVDYRSVEYTLVFHPGTVLLNVSVPVIADLKDELNETLVVTLSDAFLVTTSLTLADDTGVGTIVDDDAAPVVSIADTTVTELDGTDDVQMEFTVMLSNPSWQTLRFDWRLLQVTNADGSLAFDSAIVGTDYLDETGAVRFNEDVVTRTFNVTVKADALDEYDERLLARLSRHADTPASGFSMGDDTATGTITDNDATPYVSVHTVTPQPVAEGHAGNRPVQLEIRLEAVSGRPVIVQWNTQRGTALEADTLTDFADFVYTFETVTFEPGETVAGIEVNIVGDTRTESEEYFFVNLLTAVNGSIGVTAARPNHAVVSIANDESTDPGPWYIQFSDANYSVTEGGVATITVVRAGDSSLPVAVYWTAGGTARPGVDYDSALNPNVLGGQRGLVRFGPGETLHTFTIATYDNFDSDGHSVYEGDETIRLHLANPTGGDVRGLITDATLTIVEDDPAPTVIIGDAESTGHFAGELSTSALTFTVSVVGSSELPVKVRFTSISGTATAEDDFITKSGLLEFPVSALNVPQTVVIPILPDTEIEETEDLFVVLTDPVNATIGDDPDDSDATGGETSNDRGFGIILDDDEASLTGTVFFDANANGFRDGSTDYGFAGVKVTLIAATDGAKYEATTGADGAYAISLPLDDYTVSLDEAALPEGASATSFVLPYGLALQDSELVLDLGFELSAATVVAEGSTGSGSSGNNDTVYGGLGNDDIDGGSGDDWLIGGHWLGPGGASGAPPYAVTLKEILSGATRTRVYVDPASLPAPGILRGRVWVDSDGDQTEVKPTPGNESGLAGVQVNLYDATWTLIASAFTDTNGGYEFGNLAATTYQVQFQVPGGYAFVTKGVGAAANDSDADATVGLTAGIAVAEGRTISNVDAGVRLLPAGTAPWNVSFSHAVYSVRETDGAAVITLVGDGASAAPVAVYRTANGTASLDDDYLSTLGIVRYGPGETKRLVPIVVLVDDKAEGYETILLSLTNPAGGAVKGAQKTAVVLIFDNAGLDDDAIEGAVGNDVLLGDFGWFTDAGVTVLLGGMGNDDLAGGEGGDTLEGEGGNDTLEGGTGDDRLNGGSENDTYLFDTDTLLGTDTIGEGTSPLGGADTLDFSSSGLALNLDLAGTVLTVLDGTATVLVLNYPANVLENVVAGSGNDVLLGNDLDNVLDAGAGDDVIEGRGGDDDLTGGSGSDLFVFDADNALGHDDLFEASSKDTDTIDFGETSGQAVALDLSLTTSQVVSPTLTLTLNTASPEQTLLLLNGTLVVAQLRPVAFGSNTTLSSGIENLYGGRYAPGVGVQDRLSGNSRDNVIWGREGNDTLSGGSSGYDTLKEERAGDWNLTSTTLVNDTTLETDTFTAGTFDEITLAGDDSANTLDASSFSGLVRLDGAGGDDVLIGGSGTNYLTGGAGQDRIDGTLGFDILTEQRDADFHLTSTRLRIGIEIDTLVGAIEEARLTGGEGPNDFDASGFNGPVELDGGAGDDSLVGSIFDDLLTGGAGKDGLAGGAGNDRYLFDADSALGLDSLTERPGEGIDTLDFSATESLGATVSLALITLQIVNDNLVLVLSSATTFEAIDGTRADDALTGNDLVNLIRGLEGSDRISGGLGADTLEGGDGVSNAGVGYVDTLVESRDANITLEPDVLRFNGVAEDALSGFEAAEITGGAGNNTLDASLFEGSVRLDGGDGQDVLRGGFGPDTLIGAGGNDALSGGYGDDTYLFDADTQLGIDTVEDVDGTDTLDFGPTSGRNVQADLGTALAQTVNPNLTLTLASGTVIENARGGSLNDTLTGNRFDNTLEGGDGNDRLNGVAGDDLLVGGEGDDEFVFSIGAASQGTDAILEDVGAGGTDTLFFNGATTTGITLDLGVGGRQDVHLNLQLLLIRGHSIENVMGSSAADRITGNSLDNRIEGRGGDDVLSGGLGNDVYAFDADAALGSDTLIEDPVEGGFDTIDFSATAADIGSSGSPFSLRTATPQVVNPFLTLTLTGGRGFEAVIPGSGRSFVARASVPVFADVMDDAGLRQGIRLWLPPIGKRMLPFWKMP
ncbi:MAG: M10 family metallopeptidase C-terminal domain-containing protein [Verrucomicrobiales bacterium]|nr:M10 family metallopeptidase C-terminal domain-containing protein [Verrucomicrobiales bacterium]